MIRIITIGNKMPIWVEQGYHEYAKRFSFSLELIEIPLEKRTKNSDISRLKQKEGEKILSYVKPDDHVVVLEVKGKELTSEALANTLSDWQRLGKNIDILIGGPDGLSEACLKRANMKWSLSPLTLPHPLVRIILAEQLYRAMTIIQGHPYHR